VRRTRGVHRGVGPGVLLVVLTVAAAIGSLLPQTAPPGNGVDLFLHLLFYAALTVLASVASGRLWLAAPMVFLYSAALEGLQGLVPGRDSSIDDLIANAVGVACGIAVIAMWAWARRSKPSLPVVLSMNVVPIEARTTVSRPRERLAKPEAGAGT